MGPLSSKDIKSITSSKTIPEHKNNTLAKALSAAYPLRKIEGVEAIATSLLNIISKQCKKKIGQIKLIFRGSEHKFRSNAFHQTCNTKKNTLIIALTNSGQVYGGFTICQWKNDELMSYESDEEKCSFLFTIQQSKQVKHFNLKEGGKKFAIMNDQQLGPVFGEGHDLLIADEADKKESWNNLGKSYDSQFKFGSIKANCELGKAQKFILREYEVWQIIFS